MTVTTGNNPKELWPGLKASFDGMKSARKAVWEELFRKMDSDKKYEEVISLYGTGLVEQKPEGQAMTYDDMSQGLTIRHTAKSYGKGIIITQEAMDDNLYVDLGTRGMEYLSKSHHTTREFTHANILSRGFTVANNHQEGGDGKTLFAADHIVKSGVYSNLLTAASLSRAALEDALIQISLAKDETGIHFSGLNATKLIVPEALRFEAMRILQSTYQPEDDTNAINPMMNVVKLVPWRYLDGSSSTAWFLQTDADYGLIHYERKPVSVRQVNDDDTMNVKIQSMSRYIEGVIDPRGIYGNVGA